MLKKIILILLPAVLFSTIASAAPGDYDPAYDQGGGYGAATLDERVVKLEKKLSGDSQIELLNRVEQLQKDVLLAFFHYLPLNVLISRKLRRISKCF